MSKLKPEVNSSDHIQGRENAPIELVEYGDFECPYCAQAYGVVKNIQNELGEDLKFVFRNFPLTQVHPHSYSAAIAAEIAGAQGKYWEMHNILFENQKALHAEDLMIYALKIGLDPYKFQNDFKNPTFKDKVKADFESGVRSGVNSTPSFYINGEKYEDMLNEQTLLSYLKALQE